MKQPTITPERLEFATTIMVRESIRQWNKLHPGDPASCPVKAFAEYPPRQRAALMKSVLAAYKSLVGNEELFETFLKQKAELQEAK